MNSIVFLWHPVCAIGMEYWNAGILGIKAENKPFKLSKTPSNPSFHYSIWGEAPKFFKCPWS
jgi:hypothetical protein